MTNDVYWTMSCDSWGDGKSICLWRSSPGAFTKIARFQCDTSAKIFAEEMGFPVNDKIKKRFDKLEDMR